MVYRVQRRPSSLYKVIHIHRLASCRGGSEKNVGSTRDQSNDSARNGQHEEDVSVAVEGILLCMGAQVKDNVDSRAREQTSLFLGGCFEIEVFMETTRLFLVACIRTPHLSVSLFLL